MNHPSEWTRYYDAPKGTYRYKHKGTGVVRDTLMAIGRRFTKKATKEKARQALKKAVNEASKQMLKKAAEKAEEKAAEKIQAVLRSGVSNSVADPRPKSKKTPQRGSKKTTSLSTESRQKLKKMLTSGVPHTATQLLSGDSRKKLNQILNAGRAAKLKVNQYLAEI